HRGGAAQERERTDEHALVANRYQLRHAATIARGQDGDRIAIAGPEQLGVPLARHLRAQALAVRITLGERAPRGLGHLACDVKHLKRRTGLAAAGALERRQRDFPMAEITRGAAPAPSLRTHLPSRPDRALIPSPGCRHRSGSCACWACLLRPPRCSRSQPLPRLRAKPTGTLARGTIRIAASPPARASSKAAAKLRKIPPSPTMSGGTRTGARATSTAPSPTTARRSGSIPNTPRSTTYEASLTGTRAISTAPSPTTARRSGSIPSWQPPTTTGATRTRTRAISTAPSPTSARRSGSLPRSKPPIQKRSFAALRTTTAAARMRARATSTAPLPTSAK